MVRPYLMNGQISHRLIIHTVVRGVLFFLSMLMTLKVSEFARLAGINSGIIGCIFSLAAAINTLTARFYFGEHLSVKKYIGIGLILVGICWIALLKAQKNPAHPLDEAHSTYYKTIAIICAISVACINSSRVFEIKLLSFKYKKEIVESLVDMALYAGLIMALITLFYYGEGDATLFNVDNLVFGFVGSLLFFICTCTS